MALCLMALFYRLLKRNGGRLPALAAHLSKHINSYYCISFVLYTPLGTLMVLLFNSRLPGRCFHCCMGCWCWRFATP